MAYTVVDSRFNTLLFRSITVMASTMGSKRLYLAQDREDGEMVVSDIHVHPTIPATPKEIAKRIRRDGQVLLFPYGFPDFVYRIDKVSPTLR